MPAKKYKLYAAGSDNGGKNVCAFFLQPGGCRNGDSCKFLHGEASQSTADAGAARGGQTTKTVSDQDSVVSSESEETVPKPVLKRKQTPTPKAKKGKKKKKQQNATPAVPESAITVPNPVKVEVESMVEDDGNPFLPPSRQADKSVETTTTPSSKKKRKTKDDANGASASTPRSAKKTRRNYGDKTGAAVPAPKTKKEPVAEECLGSAPRSSRRNSNGVPVADTVTDFRNFASALPVASFSIPGVTTPTVPVASGANASYGTDSKKESDGTSILLPRSTEVGRSWQKTVLKTREHSKYDATFDWVKCIQSEVEQGVGSEDDWFKAKPYGEWCKNNPQAIAIDCEMCETRDPETGRKNHKALCRLSVVNAEKPDEVLIDTLVKPEWPVSDYRTWVNGIKKEHMEGVEFTMEHAQAFMKALCSEETVIVGHAVHNDLVSLKMEHYCIADSVFLYEAADSSTSSVSLKDLVKTLFQKDMPSTHDSVNDARKALECVAYYRDNDGDVPRIERTPRNRSHQLLVHRIPKSCKKEHFLALFVSHTTIQPTEVEDIQFTNETHGKTHVTFKSSKHASLAFDTLLGAVDEDKSGRLQKKVYLRDGGYVRVRMMVAAKKTPGTPSGGTSGERK